jgi:hypothetical protein
MHLYPRRSSKAKYIIQFSFDAYRLSIIWKERSLTLTLTLTFEVFKKQVASTDAIPYAYTVLAKKGSTVQIYWFVAGMSIDTVHKVGSDTFWNEMKQLESNEYVRYLNTKSE